MVSMAKDTRKCSHCGHHGHNSRTCNSKGLGGIKLFGVRIDDNNINNPTKMKIESYESIRKSKSLGNLEHAANYDHNSSVEAGYLSDGLIHSPRHKKKGTSWTEEEHKYFLIGLEKLGKGDWRGISKYYVPSRTPTQVASHAQKYFIRMASIDKKKRRPSVFDMHLKELNSPILPKSSPSISNKVPEVSKEGIKGVAGATCERPPLSPSSISRPFGVPSLHHMPDMAGVGRNIQGVTTGKVGATISWIPVVFQNQNHGHVRNYSQYPAFVPFVARPTIGLSSQADHSTPMTNKDGLKCKH